MMPKPTVRPSKIVGAKKSNHVGSIPTKFRHGASARAKVGAANLAGSYEAEFAAYLAGARIADAAMDASQRRIEADRQRTAE